MKYGIFLIIPLFFALFFFINVYIGKNLKFYLRVMGVKFRNPKLYWIVFMGIAMSYLFARALSRFMPRWLDMTITNIGAYYLAVMMYAIIFIGLLKFLYFCFKEKLRFRRARIRAVKLFGTATVISIAGLMIYGSYNAKDTVVTEYDISIDKESEVDEIKLVFVSDIHLGNIVGNRRLEELIEQINSESPDIVLFGGDIVDEDVEFFIEEKMVDRFEKIESKYGVYGVLGNHEYIGGSEEEFEQILGESQIKILKDDYEEVGGIVIAGRDDLSGERFTGRERSTVGDIVGDIDRSEPIVLMDHQPLKSGETEDLGVDLLLSGHTHRGQLFPGAIITSIIYGLDWGLTRYGDMQAVVSSGYGTWGPPVRIGSNSEIVVLKLKFK